MIKKLIIWWKEFNSIEPLTAPPISNFGVAGLIVALVAVLYANTLGHGFVMDDRFVIQTHQYVQQGLAGLDDIFSSALMEGAGEYGQKLVVRVYRPISLTQFALVHQVAGLDPWAYHLSSLILYALLGILIFKFLTELFEEKYPGLALLCTIIFIMHPLHSEVVANVKSNDEMLSLTLALLSNYFFLIALKRNSAIRIILASVFYWMALGSKETAITFVALIPLTIYFFKEYSIKTLALKVLLPLLVSASLFLLARWWVLHDMGEQILTYVDNPIVLAETASEWIGVRFYMLGQYLWLFLFPVELTSSYFYNDFEIVSLLDYRAYISLLAYVFLIVWSVAYLRKINPLVFGVIHFLTTVFLFSNLLYPLGNSFGERWAFTPSLGLCILFGAIFYRWAQYKTAANDFQKFLPWGTLLVILTLWSVKTIDRNTAWKDRFTLAKTDLQISPNSQVLNKIMATELLLKAGQDKEKIKESIPYFEKVMKLNPEHFTNYTNFATAQFRIGNYERAIELLEFAYGKRPDMTLNQQTLAMSYAYTGKYLKADSLWRQMMNRPGYDGQFRLNRILARIYNETSEVDRSIFHAKEALKHAGQDIEPVVITQISLDLANLLYTNQRQAEAIPYYKQVAKTEQTNFALMNRIAGIYIDLDSCTAAIPYMDNSLEIDSTQAPVYFNLWKCHQALGNTDEAKASLEGYNRYRSTN